MTTGDQLFDELWGFYTQRLSARVVSPLDFAELVTYLLFLKLDDERGNRPIHHVRVIDEGLGWPSLATKTGSGLDEQFQYILAELAKKGGIEGAVFRGAFPPIRNPAQLAALITDIIAPRRWSREDPGALAAMYQNLLVRAAENFNIESGQTLTPLPLVSTVIDCLRPTPVERVVDPACGTGSLLVAAYQAMSAGDVRLGNEAIIGVDLDDRMCRLATMNLLLSTSRPFNEPPPVSVGDSLAVPLSKAPTIVVCNPPFRSTAPTPRGRQDFITTTGNIQLNFLQLIVGGMPIGARAAVFVPDNVLFMSGAAKTIRAELMRQCDLHTLLRLPTGVFKHGGVKSNILFFDKRGPRPDGSAATEWLWVYDFRTSRHFQATQSPLGRNDLSDFVSCYRPGEPHLAREPSERFRRFSYQELVGPERDLNLNIRWLREDAATDEALPPKLIAQEIADELGNAAAEFVSIAEQLPDQNVPNEDK